MEGKRRKSAFVFNTYDSIIGNFIPYFPNNEHITFLGPDEKKINTMSTIFNFLKTPSQGLEE